MRIAVDTGGTFTDCVRLRGSRVEIRKVFSTPVDSSAGILDGVSLLAGGLIGDERLDIIHGTTVGTNSLLERRGARVALVTTAGFEDLLEIGRQNRPRLYDLNVQREPPLVLRSMRWGVHERTAADGKILLRPALTELLRLRVALKRSHAESVAICFLFSFRNSKNEKQVAQLLRVLDLPVSVSHEILPEFREYERLSSVVINAYLAPRLGTYLRRLALRVRTELGNPRHDGAGKTAAPARLLRTRTNGSRNIFVMQSSGGITTASRAAREPVRTILSGPAGGVVASAMLAKQLGLHRTISFDMGGTSTDVCLLNGPPHTTRETTLAGLPVAVPVLDVHSVGAGGGSLARVDAGGALRVGPESAGAVPGPICYGKGGTRPTVTDAHLLLGRLDPDFFLGGSFHLDAAEVERHFSQFIRSVPANIRAWAPTSPVALAHGIVAVSNATMERALRLISVERGHDPRDFTLICFGGAGGLHAADLARALELAGVIVPLHPGAFSALGILLSDVVKDVSRSLLMTVPTFDNRDAKARRHCVSMMKDLEHKFSMLAREGLRELRREHFDVRRVRIERRLALRYVGQAYELSLPFARNFQQRFHHEHEVAYGHSQPDLALEIVSLQVRLVLPTPKLRQAPELDSKHTNLRGSIVKRKSIWFDHRRYPTPLYERAKLPRRATISGPAIIIEYSSTTVVPPDFTCRVDRHMNLILTHHAH